MNRQQTNGFQNGVKEIIKKVEDEINEIAMASLNMSSESREKTRKVRDHVRNDD